MKPQIIFEDENFLVIEKPFGWVVNDAETVKHNLVIQKWLSENFDFPVFKDRELRNGIVHRLDKDTSGLLLIAKNKESFEKLQGYFRERKIEKEYTLLAHGKVKPKEGSINASLGRLPWNRTHFGVIPGGRESDTGYETIEEYNKEVKVKGKENPYYTLIRAYPKTGRTHQIRVHMKHIGNPIVSDPLYAGRKTYKRDIVWCPRLFLHASKLTIPKEFCDTYIFESMLPKDLSDALNMLEKI